MKTRLTRRDIEIDEESARALFGDGFVQDNSHRVVKHGDHDRLCWREGTVLDAPDSWTFVMVGAGTPVDKECIDRCSKYGDWALRIDARAEAYQDAEDRISSSYDTLSMETQTNDWHFNDDSWDE